jgi:hypothetical protein
MTERVARVWAIGELRNNLFVILRNAKRDDGTPIWILDDARVFHERPKALQVARARMGSSDYMSIVSVQASYPMVFEQGHEFSQVTHGHAEFLGRVRT